MDQLLKVEQVAACLQVHRITVYRYLRLGMLGSIKLGNGARRIRESELERFLRASERGAS